MPGVTVRHHREVVSLWQRQNVPKQMPMPQLLKRKWSEGMTRNVRMARGKSVDGAESRGESARNRAANCLP
eukprot:5061385-Prymnesium_polylepis.1